MTNCQKCGNPLQPGSTTCPICGTTAAPADAMMTAPAPIEQLESLDETPMVSPVPQVQPAPVMEPGPIAAPAQSMTAQPMQPAAPVAPAPIQPAAPMVSPAQPMNPIPTPAQPMMQPADPMMQPAQPMQPQPSVMPEPGFAGASPMPAAPNPIPTPSIPAPSAPIEKKEEPKKETKTTTKGKSNLTTVVLVAIVALVLGLGAGYLLGPSLKAAPTPAPVVVADTETQRVSGFNFDMKTEWSYNDYYDKVIINNAEETVTMRLALYAGVFTNINTTNIELSLSTKEGYADVKAEKTTVGNRDAVLVNASNGDLRIQYYYIAHSVDKIITITTVYETEEAKKAEEENVKKLIESTTYTDEVQNAIQVIDTNSKYFDDATYVYYDSFTKEETKPITDPSTQPTE